MRHFNCYLPTISCLFLQGGDPTRVGVAMTDLSTGLYAHGAIMAALMNRLNTGKGQKIQCNLLSSQVGKYWMSSSLAYISMTQVCTLYMT